MQFLDSDGVLFRAISAGKGLVRDWFLQKATQWPPSILRAPLEQIPTSSSPTNKGTMLFKHPLTRVAKVPAVERWPETPQKVLLLPEQLAAEETSDLHLPIALHLDNGVLAALEPCLPVSADIQNYLSVWISEDEVSSKACCVEIGNGSTVSNHSVEFGGSYLSSWSSMTAGRMPFSLVELPPCFVVWRAKRNIVSVVCVVVSKFHKSCAQ
jgi:hypothetical protein